MGGISAGKNKLRLFAAFAFLAIVFLFFRLINIDTPLALDEVNLKTAYLEPGFPGNFIGHGQQPILFQLPNSILAAIFGVGNWVFRATSLITSIITVAILLSYITKKLSLKHALAGLLIIAILPWQVNASTQALHTSLLTLFIFASLISAEKFVETKSNIHLACSILFSFLSMMTMLIAMVVPITIFLYLLLSDDKLSKKVVPALAYGISYTLLVLGGFAVVYLIHPENLTATFSHAKDLAASSMLPVLGIPSLFILFLWIGPISLLFLLILLKKPRYLDCIRNIHLLFVAVSVLVLFLLNSDAARPFDRYFMIIIPSMVFLILMYGRGILAEISKKKIMFIMAALGFFAIFLIFGLSISHKVIPLEPKLEFVKSFFMNFGKVLVPYSSNGGPVGFYVPGTILLAGWLIASLLLLASLVSKNKTFAAILFAEILAFNICVCLFQAGIMGMPNPTMATSHLMSELEQVQLEKTIFVYRNQGFNGYLPNGLSAERFELSTFDETIFGAANYSVIIVNFPLIPKDSDIWEKLDKCERIYHSNGFGIEELIYTCRIL